MPRPAQPWLIRATHWANLVLFTVMAGSGLRILIAYPFLGPRGEPYGWYPLQGVAPPDALTIGGWLAGARHWHFAFAWLFVANALVYVAYLFASGEWRRRLFFPRRDARNAWGTVLHDLRLRKDAPPPVGLYNGMQRLAYTGGPRDGAARSSSPGLAMYKPVQLPRLTALLGGYDVARAIHLLVLVALALFTVVHVIQVLLHPRTLADMTVGRGERRRRRRHERGRRRRIAVTLARAGLRGPAAARGRARRRSACDSSRPHAGFLGLMERVNERFQRALFDPSRLAPELGEDEESAPGALPGVQDLEAVPGRARRLGARRGRPRRAPADAVARGSAAPSADAHARPPPLRRGLVGGRLLGRRAARGDRPARGRRPAGAVRRVPRRSTRATGRPGTSRARSTPRRSSPTG